MADSQIVELQPGRRATITPQGSMLIAFYYSLLRPQVESFWASLIYVKAVAKKREKRREASSLSTIFADVQWLMYSLYSDGAIEDYASTSLELIGRAMGKLQQMGLIRVAEGGKKSEASIEVLADVEHIAEVEDELKFYRRANTNSAFSPIEVAKLSMKDPPNPKL